MRKALAERASKALGLGIAWIRSFDSAGLFRGQFWIFEKIHYSSTSRPITHHLGHTAN